MTAVIDRFKGPFRFLSNFYVTDDGFCVEHHFQALKAQTQAEHDWVLAAPDARTAKARGYKVTKRPDWDEHRVDVMRRLLRLKFRRPELREMLLATDDAPLVEGNTWGDRFWGVCKGEGENWLGRLLMELRDELMSEKTPKNEDGEANARVS